MWRWLPSVLCNKSLGCISSRRLFFLQLIGIVFGVHFVIFMGYGIVAWLSTGPERFKISLTNSAATYVLMPFQKIVDQKNNSIASDKKNGFKKSNVIDQATYERKKNARKKSKAMVVEKKSAEKNKKNVAVSKVAQAKKEQASVLMKKESGKISKPLKAVTKIQDIASVSEIVPEKKSVEPILAEPIQELQKIPETVVPEEAEKKELAQEMEDDDFDENNVVFVGYQELDKSIIGSKIQHTIQQIWTPPVGMQKDISSEIQVKIGADGQAVQAKIIKSSGVFVYDASARKTLLSIEYPKEVCGKNITIVLGSS